MKEAILSAKGISKSFPGGGAAVLDFVDVRIYRGDFTIIMGPSGAGKSTLLYALSGMDDVSDGSVWYGEKELGKLTEKQMAALRASEFGFVFQQTHLVSNLTLFENVAVAGYLNRSASGQETVRRAQELLERMHVKQAKDRFPGQTSGGEAQRAAIARAMINRPEILFADEPTGALNRKNSEEVLDLLTTLSREGQSIVMVTHDLRAALRGNRILYLEDGKVLDELSLPFFREEDLKERERKVGDWLSVLSW